MTNTKRNYVNPLSNDNLRIPTREEFHRYAPNVLTERDFCTEHPSSSSGCQVNKVAKTLNWSMKNIKKPNKSNNKEDLK